MQYKMMLLDLIVKKMNRTFDKKLKREYKKMIKIAESLDEESARNVYNNLTMSNTNLPEMLGNYSVDEEQYNNPNIINPNLPSIGDEGGIIESSHIIRQSDEDFPVSRRTMWIRKHPLYGTIIKESIIKEIDCEHVDRPVRVIDLYGHKLCGSPECVMICNVCGRYGCKKCMDWYINKNTGEVTRAYHIHHSSWWYRWRY